MKILERLKDSEKVYLSIDSITETRNGIWVVSIEVEHSWYSSIVDALDLYDIVESGITSRKEIEDLLNKHFSNGDYKIVEEHIHLKNDFKVLENYLALMNDYIMDYLEYLDTRI